MASLNETTQGDGMDSTTLALLIPLACLTFIAFVFMVARIVVR
jgi:hypothetical protein